MYGYNEKRLRGAFGDDCHFYFGDPGAWESIGITTKWGITYSVKLSQVTTSSKKIIHVEDISSATLDIDLAQSHVDEMYLLDRLRASDTVKFWGNMNSIQGEDMECYVPGIIAGGDLKIETPASDIIRLGFSLGIQPQAGLFEFQGIDLPSVTKHGSEVLTSLNAFYHPFVAKPD